MPISSSELRHGTVSCYNVHKCRCDDCKAAKAFYARRSRERHPDYATNYYRANTEACKARTKDWVQRNRDKVRDEQRKRAALNRERYNANLRRWRSRNKAKVSEFGRRSRAKRKQAKVFKVTAKDWRELVNRFGSRCAYCGKKDTMTADHVVPLSRGGNHSIGNLLPACVTCNISKGPKFLIEWKMLCR